MKLKRFFIVLCTLWGISSGCGDGCRFTDIEWTSEHLIDEYVLVDRINLWNGVDKSKYVELKFIPKKYYPSRELLNEHLRWGFDRPFFRYADVKYQESDVEVFNELSLKHDNVGFSRIKSYDAFADDRGRPTGPCEAIYEYQALSRDIKYIEVTSDRDFNDIKAGCSLRDVVNLRCLSFSAVLKRKVEESMLVISKSLSQFTEEDLEIVGSEVASISFIEKPADSQEYNFTVTITFDDGEVVSDSVQVVF